MHFIPSATGLQTSKHLSNTIHECNRKTHKPIGWSVFQALGPDSKGDSVRVVKIPPFTLSSKISWVIPARSPSSVVSISIIISNEE